MTRLLLCAAILWLSSLAVQAATPSIETVSPGMGQRGTEFELKLIGAGFSDAEELLLYQPGVTCLSLTPASANELTLRLRAEGNCQLGSHPFRLRTRLGITELRTFRIGRFPLVASVEPNNSRDGAQSVERNVTALGVIESDDADCYRLSLKQGERLAAEVEAVRLGAQLLDLKLTVFGPDGSILVSVDDTPLTRQDPCLTLLAPQDGDYIVQVSENTLEGDSESRYALHIGTFPRPLMVYPLGGSPGETLQVRWQGDATGEFSQSVTLPQTSSGEVDLFPEQNGLSAPTPHRFRVLKGTNVLEDEQSPTPAASLPAAFNGVIQEPGDTDQFSFQVTAGETWTFDLYAARCGSPLDGVLSVYDSAGVLLVRSDDGESHDALLEFVVAQAGTYSLQVVDKRLSGGLGFAYRVEATRSEPQLTAFMPRPDRRSQDQQTICVPRGNRVMAYLGVQRNGVAGEVVLLPGQLPDGMQMDGGTLGPDRFWTPVVFEARHDAALAGGLVPLTATAQTETGTVQGSFKQVVDLVSGPGDALYHSSEVDRVAVAVTESAPFKIELQQPTAALAQDGTLDLHVSVERQPGFEGAVDITLPLLPPWVDGPPKVTVPANQSEAVFPLRAWKQVEPRTWVICAEGKLGLATEPARMGQPTTAMAAAAPVAGADRRDRRSSRPEARDVRVCSQLIHLSITPSPVVATASTVAGEQGQTAKLKLRLQSQAPLPKTLTATLEGLPNRVKTTPVSLEGALGEFEIAVELDPTAPLGEFTGLVCRLSGESDGQAVSFCVGRDSVLTVEPPGGLVTDAEGRPLSKLEALRRSQKPTQPK